MAIVPRFAFFAFVVMILSSWSVSVHAFAISGSLPNSVGSAAVSPTPASSLQPSPTPAASKAPTSTPVATLSVPRVLSVTPTKAPIVQALNLDSPTPQACSGESVSYVEVLNASGVPIRVENIVGEIPGTTGSCMTRIVIRVTNQGNETALNVTVGVRTVTPQAFSGAQQPVYLPATVQVKGDVAEWTVESLTPGQTESFMILILNRVDSVQYNALAQNQPSINLTPLAPPSDQEAFVRYFQSVSDAHILIGGVIGFVLCMVAAIQLSRRERATVPPASAPDSTLVQTPSSAAPATPNAESVVPTPGSNTRTRRRSKKT